VSHRCPECAFACSCYEGEADTETCIHCEDDDEGADLFDPDDPDPTQEGWQA
jgi:hypothetical protein